LQRHGRKNYAYYQIVVADSRAPRDGRFIERIGSYNPNTNPATIDLNFERALYWLQVGAQPTDTTRNILSREGVCMKKHLLEGVKKGAFDEATAEVKFQTWLKDKQFAIQTLKDKDAEATRMAAKARLESEKEVNKAIAEKVAQKKAEIAAAKAEESAGEVAAEAVEEVPEAAPAVVEAPVEEVEVPAEVVEAPAEEVEKPAEVVAEPVEEAPAVEETKAEEAPADETGKE